jgi:hypothetical protein
MAYSTPIRSLVQNNRRSTGLSTVCTTTEPARPIFHTARPVCWPVQEAMCAHSVSVRPICSLVAASGAVSCRRQMRVSQDAIRLDAIAASADPASPAASKSASRCVARTWIVP